MAGFCRLVASTARMKEIDRIAIEERGIPSLELMERAAGHVTDAVRGAIGGLPSPAVLVMCGTGNNGGDGLACARQLLAAGVRVETVLVGNPARQTPDSLVNRRRLEALGHAVTLYDGAPLPKCDCIVDALFGVGLNREVSGLYRAAIEAINAASCPVVACDIPSGINGDSGAVMGIAVRAVKTVTFSCAKPGLLTPPGSDYTGELTVADIGIPAELLENFSH